MAAIKQKVMKTAVALHKQNDRDMSVSKHMLGRSKSKENQILGNPSGQRWQELINTNLTQMQVKQEFSIYLCTVEMSFRVTEV